MFDYNFLYIYPLQKSWEKNLYIKKKYIKQRKLPLNRWIKGSEKEKHGHFGLFCWTFLSGEKKKI